MTYKQAYDKIIEAYFKDEIQPFDNEFCFCGTLSPVGVNWNTTTFIASEHQYTLEEYKRMEWALFSGSHNKKRSIFCLSNAIGKPQYEDTLFRGMSAALEVLKEIHRARGENVDEVPEFTKRELINQ